LGIRQVGHETPACGNEVSSLGADRRKGLKETRISQDSAPFWRLNSLGEEEEDWDEEEDEDWEEEEWGEEESAEQESF